jgi:hypothetical protein
VLNSRAALVQKEAEAKRLAQQLGELQERAGRQARDGDDARSAGASAGRLLGIAERRLALLGRERDSLKKILALVEQEAPVAAGGGGEAQLADAQARLAQARERAALLEGKQQVGGREVGGGELQRRCRLRLLLPRAACVLVHVRSTPTGPLPTRPQELEAQVEDMSAALAELASSERAQRQLAQVAAERADAADELARSLELEVADLSGQVAVLYSKLGAGGRGCAAPPWPPCSSAAAASPGPLQSNPNPPALHPRTQNHPSWTAGEYNQASTKVLHVVRNPEAEYHRLARDMRLEQLEAENAALRDNIGTLDKQAAEGGLRARRRPRLHQALQSLGQTNNAPAAPARAPHLNPHPSPLTPPAPAPSR